MWCKNNNCCHYDEKNNECTRIGKGKRNIGKKSICWMDKSEGKY